MNKIFVWIGIALIAVVSCHKKDSNSKKCNYALFALRSTGSVTYKMVSVDTSTGKSYDNLPFPELHGNEGYLSQREKSYYELQTDANGWLNLIKLDLVNKTSKIYKGRRLGTDSFLSLTYSVASKKFYFLNLYYYYITPKWSFNSIDIVSDSIRDAPVSPKHAPPLLYYPIIENELNGDIYLQWINGGYSRYARYIPLQNELIETGFSTKMTSLEFNPNDGLIYGYFPGLPLSFARVNPESGKVDTIGKISPPPGYDFSTFDACKNQYIYESQGLDGYVYLYWLDVNTGSVRKQLTAKETYSHIMCVNLD